MGELITYDILILLVNIVGVLLLTYPIYRFLKGMNAYYSPTEGKDDQVSILTYLDERKGKIILYIVVALVVTKIASYQGAVKPVSTLPPRSVEREERLKDLDDKEIIIEEVETLDHEAEKQRLIEDNEKAKERFKNL